MEQVKKQHHSSKIKYYLSTFFKEAFKRPLELIIHPISGWEDFKYDKTSKRWVSFFYLIMMIMAVIINKTLKGFVVGGGNIKDFRLFNTILTIILSVVVATIANWCVGSLFDGKGKIPEIFRVINYAFFPYVWLSIIATIISNFIGTDELMYYNILMGIGTALTIWMMFFGLKGVHENSFGMNIINIIFTIVVIAIIIFVILLFFTFMERILSWIYAVYNEIKIRYF